MTPARAAARLARLKKSLKTPENYNTKKCLAEKKAWDETKDDGLARY